MTFQLPQACNPVPKFSQIEQAESALAHSILAMAERYRKRRFNEEDVRASIKSIVDQMLDLANPWCLGGTWSEHILNEAGTCFYCGKTVPLARAVKD